MNTRKMQMYQQWIYYSEYVGKQKALESRENENELLPSALPEKEWKKKWRQGEGEDGNMEREGYEKSREQAEKKNPGPCFDYFFF